MVSQGLICHDPDRPSGRPWATAERLVLVAVVGAVAPRSRKAAEQDDTPTLLSAPVRFKENRNQMDDKLIELMWGRDKVAKSMNAQVRHTAVGSKACLVRWRELRPYGPLDGLCAVRPGQDLHLQEGAEAATKVRRLSQHAASTGTVSIEGGGSHPSCRLGCAGCSRMPMSPPMRYAGP